MTSMMREISSNLGVTLTVHQRAEALSSAHTMGAGYRIVDILHVATALQLGAVEFLTFDVNQKKLAEAEGLVVPV